MVVLTDVLNTVAYQDNRSILKSKIQYHPRRNKMDVSTLLKDYPIKDIRTPHANDVLSGRGGGTNNHPGNEKFRELVHSKKVLYVNSSKREKALVSCAIVDFIRNQSPPGRFLQRDEKSGLWYDIGDQKAREKTSQALREGAPDIRREISMGAAANALSIAASVAAGVHEHQPGPGATGGARPNSGKFKGGAGRTQGIATARSVDSAVSDEFQLHRNQLPSLSSLVANSSSRVPSATLLGAQDNGIDENVARAMYLSRNEVRRTTSGHAVDRRQEASLPFSSYDVMEMLQRKAAAISSFGGDGGVMLQLRHPFPASITPPDPRRRVSDSSIRSQQQMFNTYSFNNTPTTSDVFLQQYGSRSAAPIPSDRGTSAAAAAMMMGMHGAQPRQTAVRIQQAKAAAANAIAAVGKVLAENNMELLRDPSKANRVLSNRTSRLTPPINEQMSEPIKPVLDFTSAQTSRKNSPKSNLPKQTTPNSPTAGRSQSSSPTMLKKNGNIVTDHFKERLNLSERISKTIARGKVDSTMSKKERAATMYQFAGLIGIKLEDLTDRLSNGSNTLEELIQKAISEQESRVDVSRCRLTVTKTNMNGKRGCDSKYDSMHSTKRMKSDLPLAMKKRVTTAFCGINAF